MRENGASAVAIMEGDPLVGIITERDLVASDRGCGQPSCDACPKIA
jgi:CBS domain-containing protein